MSFEAEFEDIEDHNANSDQFQSDPRVTESQMHLIESKRMQQTAELKKLETFQR